MDTKLSRTEIAMAKSLKADAEVLAAMCEDNCIGNPHVQDEDGNWLTKDQLVNRLRNSWSEDMLERGFPHNKVMSLRRRLG